MVNADQEQSLAYLFDPAFELSNTAGRPLTGGYIELYIHGTRNKYYACSDFDGTLHPFQIPLDSLGANIVLVSPEYTYDAYIYSKYGTLVMSRYNVAPVLGGSVSVSGINDIVSNDGTVTINQYGETFSLSIADTVSAVSGLDIRVQDLESAVTGIEESLAGKKDLQAPYNASGTNVQTITSVTQDANGVITVEYSDIQAQNPLTPGQYVTIDNDVISVTGLQPEGDYATKDYVDAAVSGLEPIDITSTDGSISVSSSVSGSVRVFDISVSGGQPVYFRGGDTWIQVSGTTADFSAVKKFDGTIVPSDIVSGTVPLEDGLWAWDAIVDIYVGGHVNELVKCGIKGQAVGGAYDPDSETELLIDSTRPGVINSFTLTGLSRGGPNTRLAFTFTRESSSTSTMWVRMRRLSVYQVKGPGVSQSGGGGDYEAGWGIIINGGVISVNNAIIPDIDTVSDMIQEAISGIPAQVQSDWTEDDSTDPSYIQNKPQEIALVAGENITITASGASAVISSTGGSVSGYVTEQELATVSGDIVNQIPDVSGFATHSEVNIVSGAIITEVNNVSGAIVELIPETSGYATRDEVNTVSGAIVAMIPEVEITPALASGTKIAEYSIDGVSGELFAPEVSGGADIFYATYGTTTFAEITAASTAGKLVVLHKSAAFAVNGYDIPLTDVFISNNHSSSYARFIAPFSTNSTSVHDIAANKQFEINGNNVWTNKYVYAIPTATTADSGKVLGCINNYGYYNVGWVDPPAGPTYTAGDYISIENDVIAVTGIDPDSFASQADLEAVSAAIPSGSYDLVAGQNITITASGTNLVISGQQGGTNVTITPDYNYGTRVARYSIDGVNGSIYTPTQVNANWNETSSSSKAYIQNKPTIHTYTGASGVAIDANDVVSLDSPVELVPGSNITIEVSGVSAIISSTGGGGTTYTAGNMINLTNNAIAVSTTAGITDIQTVASLPANPVSTVLYLIPEA